MKIFKINIVVLTGIVEEKERCDACSKKSERDRDGKGTGSRAGQGQGRERNMEKDRDRDMDKDRGRDRDSDLTNMVCHINEPCPSKNK